jgi:hypothetical protein
MARFDEKSGNLYVTGVPAVVLPWPACCRPACCRPTPMRARCLALPGSSSASFCHTGRVTWPVADNLCLPVLPPPAELGRVASHYYIRHSSVETYNELLKPHMSEEDVLAMMARSSGERLPLHLSDCSFWLLFDRPHPGNVPSHCPGPASVALLGCLSRSRAPKDQAP